MSTKMRKITFLGSGAAPGVPSLCCGFGDCDPLNPKNIRSRTSTYIEYDGIKILIDTSPDLRWQLINNNIRSLDGILYTHVHADHLHGIDELREINRLTGESLNYYATAFSNAHIEERFSYLIAQKQKSCDVIRRPSLISNIISPNEPFFIKGLKITPLRLLGHNIESIGYAFNDGELVYIADFKSLDDSVFDMIKKTPALLVMPLTTPFGQQFHAGLDEVLGYIARIKPQKAVLNHMASECDYNAINAATPENIEPAYDNLSIEF